MAVPQEQEGSEKFFEEERKRILHTLGENLVNVLMAVIITEKEDTFRN